MRKSSSKGAGPGVNVTGTGKTAIASTMKNVFGRKGKARKPNRMGR